MDDTIKAAIRTAHDSLDKLDDLFESLVDELPEHTKGAQRHRRVIIEQIRGQLDIAAHKAEVGVEEAKTQAHLGALNAKERIEATRPVVEEYLKTAKEKSKTALDEAELKAKLAAMEAEDFWETQGKPMSEEFQKSAEQMASKAEELWETQGKPMSEEFQKSAEQMASVASSAANDLQSRLGKWMKTFEPKK